MDDMLDEFLFPWRPTADRPLLGQTVLAVEDSRFAGETLRLMCLRGGARIRRADSLRAAARHLKGYRPSIVLVDPGLPDGSGLDLIAQLAGATPRVAVLLAISGDPAQRDAALAAGADEFVEKPFGSVAQFHATLLAHLPPDARPRGLRAIRDDRVAADPDALQDDYHLIGSLLDDPDDSRATRYAVDFTATLARSLDDVELLGAAAALKTRDDGRAPSVADCARLAGLVQKRLTAIAGPAAARA